ncbi:hypothetical protein [Rhizobium leguminosarum]
MDAEGAKKIFVEIGQEQPQAAERYFQQFRYKAGLLFDHPRLGERHPEPSVRRGCSSKLRM